MEQDINLVKTIKKKLRFVLFHNIFMKPVDYIFVSSYNNLFNSNLCWFDKIINIDSNVLNQAGDNLTKALLFDISK